MTPGTYLRLRREAAGMTTDAVAPFVITDPSVPTRTRAEWIESIEAGAHRVPYAYVIAIEPAFSFDPAVLDALVMVEAGDLATAPQVCRRCACSELDPCVDEETHDTCAWADWDLCTACAARLASDVLELTPEQQLPPAIGPAA